MNPCMNPMREWCSPLKWHIVHVQGFISTRVDLLLNGYFLKGIFNYIMRFLTVLLFMPSNTYINSKSYTEPPKVIQIQYHFYFSDFPCYLRFFFLVNAFLTKGVITFFNHKVRRENFICYINMMESRLVKLIFKISYEYEFYLIWKIGVFEYLYGYHGTRFRKGQDFGTDSLQCNLQKPRFFSV